MSHPVRDLALAFTDAHEATLPRVTGRFRFTDREVKAYVFPQSWAGDAPGGAAPNEVYTVVMLATLEYAAAVYFGGALAYAVDLKDKQVLEHFLESLRTRLMPSSNEARERYGASYYAPQPRRAKRRLARPAIENESKEPSQ